MKTKLLKKVRKRYAITYFSKEVTLHENTYQTECMVLVDRYSEYCIKACEIGDYHKKIFESWAETKQNAKNHLLRILMEWIKSDYKRARKRKRKQTIETIWYK